MSRGDRLVRTKVRGAKKVAKRRRDIALNRELEPVTDKGRVAVPRCEHGRRVSETCQRCIEEGW